MNITIKCRKGDFYAWVIGRLDLYGYGRTPEEALGNLVLKLPEEFRIKIKTI